MADSPKVLIVLGRCQQRKDLFGMRVEMLEHGRWAANWAFAIREQAAHRERYDSNTITGSIEIAAAYPGCPTCEAKSFFACGACKKVGCWDRQALSVACPWCDHRAELGGLLTKLQATGDR